MTELQVGELLLREAAWPMLRGRRVRIWRPAVAAIDVASTPRPTPRYRCVCPDGVASQASSFELPPGRGDGIVARPSPRPALGRRIPDKSLLEALETSADGKVRTVLGWVDVQRQADGLPCFTECPVAFGPLEPAGGAADEVVCTKALFFDWYVEISYVPNQFRVPSV